MKKIALFMAIAIAAIACKPEEKIVPEVNVITTEEALVVPTDGGSVNVDFNANVAWTAALKEAVDWCSISPKDGLAGDASIRVLLNENDTNDERKAVIVITAETAVKEVTITQLQKDAVVLDGDKNVAINGDAQQLKVKVAHNVALEVTSDAEWLTVPASKAMETSELVFDVKENKTEAERVAHITIKGEGDLKAEVTVTQSVWAARVNIEPAVFEMLPVEGGTVSFTVDANIKYEVETSYEWLVMSNEGNTYTFTVGALDSNSNRHGSIKVVPEEGYLFEAEPDDQGNPIPLIYSIAVSQKGYADVVWMKETKNYTDFTMGSTAVRLAHKDNMLLVSTGAEVHALNAETGEYLQKIALPDGFQAHSMVSDAAGNILVAARCEWGDGSNVFSVFKVSSLDQINTPAPPIINYVNNSIWGAIVGNLRVYGDVNGDALIVAFCGTTNYALTWTVTGGVVGDAVFYALPAREIWAPENGFVAPLGTKVSDGMFYNGYGNSYAYAYCADAATDNTWNDVFPAFSTWESGPSGASVVEMGGKKYMACVEHTFFPQWACPTYVYILDVTNPAAPVMFYNSDGIALGIDALAASAGDVLLLPGENCLKLYAVCNSQGVIAHVTVPVK